MNQVHKVILGVLVAYILYRMFMARECYTSSTDIGLIVIFSIAGVVVVSYLVYVLGFVAL